MARIIFNKELLSGASGRIGDFVIRQTKRGPVLCMRPEKGTYKPNERQRRNTEKFKRAAAYASAINRDPELRKQYKPNPKKGHSIYNIAFKDYMNRPEGEFEQSNAINNEPTVQINSPDDIGIAPVKREIISAKKNSVKPKGKDQHVTKHPHGGWQVKAEGNKKATIITATPKEAINAAIPLAKKQRSEVVIHGVNGKIRDKDSYGNDPNPARDRKK